MIYFAKYQSKFYKILSFDDFSCELDPQQTYNQINSLWEKAPHFLKSAETVLQTGTLPQGLMPIKVEWSELEIPLPEYIRLNSWAYGLTYSSHQKDVQIKKNKFVLFKKEAIPSLHWGSLSLRENLDYELEIGILISLKNLSLCGFILLNDFTDRKIQLELLGSKNLSHGFSVSKSFPGALSVGAILGIGNFSDFYKLRAQLFLNGVLKQNLEAEHCKITEGDFFQQIQWISQKEPQKDWIIIATGTPAGTLFQTPSRWNLLKLLILSKFSIKRTKQLLLNKTLHLKPNDEIFIKSPQLGLGRLILKKDI